MLWLVVAAVVLVPAVAVLADAPSAVIFLAATCAVLAALRATRRHEPAAFRARSRTFDLTALVLAVVALIALAPAGYLT